MASKVFWPWFVGFVEADGCFSLSKRHKPRRPNEWSLGISLIITLRADDIHVLHRISRTTGGRVTLRERGAGKAPVASLSIHKKRDVANVIDNFRLVGLMSKKARDFDVWARAAELWWSAKPKGAGPGSGLRGVRKDSRIRSACEKLCEELKASRAFEYPPGVKFVLKGDTR